MCQFLSFHINEKKKKNATAANNKTLLLGGFEVPSFPPCALRIIIADGRQTRQGMRKSKKSSSCFPRGPFKRESAWKKKRPPFFSGKKPKSVSRTSRKLRNPSAFKCDWWTKISSLPSSGMINPNPLLALNHLTVFYFILESQERDRDRREKEDDVSDRSDF